MRVLVQKYGGSSVATTERLQQVAQKIMAARQTGADVVAVVSAMGKTTNGLLSLVHDITPAPDHRELDMLLSAGERIAIALLSMAIQSYGGDAISLTGPQAGIRTDDMHLNARIVRVDPSRIQEELARGKIVIVAGFQGRSHRGEVTTLGRGGSDTTAVALAAALGAARCEIYSDVDGVYTVDPRIVPTARRLEEMSYEDMYELARQGAQVLNADAVAFARQHQVEIVARSTFDGKGGTRIREADRLRCAASRVSGVTGLAGRGDLLHLCLTNLSAQPLRDQSLLNALAACEILYLGPSPLGSAAHRLEVLASCENVADLDALVARLRDKFADALTVSTGLGSVTVVGPGLGAQFVVQRDLQQRLRQARLSPVRYFTTPGAVIYVVAASHVETGLQTLHRQLFETPQSGGWYPLPTQSHQRVAPLPMSRFV